MQCLDVRVAADTMLVSVSLVLVLMLAGCRHLYISNCAIGISAVLFALKVVLNHDAPTYSSFMGFTLPTKVGGGGTCCCCLVIRGWGRCAYVALPARLQCCRLSRTAYA
jgi:hypothetical protein